MTWNAAATGTSQLLLLEDSTQTLKMEPELHNTCTTRTVILNGRSWSWSSDRSFKQTQQRALSSSNRAHARRHAHTHKTSLLPSETGVPVVSLCGFFTHHNRNQTHSHSLHPHLIARARDCRPVLNGNRRQMV